MQSDILSDNSINELSLLRGKRLLFIEDEALNRSYIEFFFRMHNVTFDTARDGLHALTLLTSHNYDLILTNIEIPHINGIIVTGIIRHTLCLSTPVVAFTAYDTTEVRECAIRAGARHCLVTPLYFDKLLECFSDIFSPANA